MKRFKTIISAFSIATLLIMSVASKAQTQAVLRTVSAENKVAILPITYSGDGNDVRMEEMRYRLQSVAYQYLKGEAMELRFQDPAETNALLLKKGITSSHFREFTPKELAELLQVEYVLIGMVNQESVGVSTTGGSRRVDFINRRGRHERQTLGHTRTREDMSTNIDLAVYNDKGENIYSKSRRSILSNIGAYKNGIEYLLKRSPLYRK